MKKYLYETHCHTSEVSTCGEVAAKEAVENYIRAGYSGIVITDHFNADTFEHMQTKSYDEMVSHYLTGYNAAKEAAKGRLSVFLGLELRFYENFNDYLVYGVTEEFLRSHTDLMEMGIEKFFSLAHQNGIVIFQAHPFRNNMTMVNPVFIDGIEVYNGNPRHDSRNDIARAWAEKFGKKMSSGSDYHEEGDLARGGIVTREQVTNISGLIRALMSGGAEMIEC